MPRRVSGLRWSGSRLQAAGAAVRAPPLAGKQDRTGPALRRGRRPGTHITGRPLRKSALAAGGSSRALREPLTAEHCSAYLAG